MQLHLDLCFQNGHQEQRQLSVPITIGKSSDNDVVIGGWRVMKEHAQIFLEGQALYIEDFGTLGGTVVNQKRISRYGPLKVGDEIIIGACLITVLRIVETEVLTSVSNTPSVMPHREVPDRHAQQKLRQLQSFLHQQLVQELDLRRKDIEALSDTQLREQARVHLLRILTEQSEQSWPCSQEQLINLVLNEAIGLGPLEPLLAEEDITEIMVNGFDQIYVERGGKCEWVSASFSSEAALLAIIERIVSPLGRRIDDSSPMVDARLKDGSRVNAVIAPVAILGPCLTIRKFSRHRLDLAQLQQKGALSAVMAQFLQYCVQHKKNMVVAGGTGSGKTTLLNSLSNYIPDHERIITIEDAAELQLKQGNVVSLEARPANSEGKGLITIRDLVRNALRMRPDRIVVGECRGAEAFDMLSAMNTGHEGSLTTLHANSPRDALARLETLILMAGMDLPLHAVREHIASALHLIIQQSRLQDGRRVISRISEITGMESGRIQMQDLFVFDPARHTFYATGVMPLCFGDMLNSVPAEWFMPTSGECYVASA